MAAVSVRQKTSLAIGERFRRDFRKYWALYLMFIPVLAYYIVFCYFPMYGVLIAFQRYSPARGVFGSTWVGLDNFQNFFQSYYFLQITWNTFRLSLEDLIFNFPSSIIFALLINEVRRTWFKKTVQTITYLPYFISAVVVGGLIVDFTAKEGLINNFIVFFWR